MLSSAENLVPLFRVELLTETFLDCHGEFDNFPEIKKE
jgi:hypothetical protein